MKEQSVMLKSYRKEIEVLVLTMDIPYYEDIERRRMFPRYEDVLLRLFNNKREDNDILKIRNYYGSNKITIEINLTSYVEDSYDKDKQECIEHLKTWFSSGLDIRNDEIGTELRKGYIYEIPEYENNIRGLEGNSMVEHYIEWED